MGAEGHYGLGGCDAIDVMEACMTPEQLDGFLRGNVIKYAVRMGRKRGETAADDAAKAADYARRLADRLAQRGEGR